MKVLFSVNFILCPDGVSTKIETCVTVHGGHVHTYAKVQRGIDYETGK